MYLGNSWYSNPMNDLPHYHEIINLFKQHHIRFVYLFGSRVTSQSLSAMSDYDFAVFVGQGSVRSRFELRLKLLYALEQIFGNVPIDVVILDDVRSLVLRYEVISTGRLLFDQAPEKRIDYELKTDHEYRDLNGFFQTYNEAYIQSAV